MKGLRKECLNGNIIFVHKERKNGVRMRKLSSIKVYDLKNSSGLALSVDLQAVEANRLLAYTESWKAFAIDMPNLGTYKTFNLSEFKTEAYVKSNVLNKRQRSVIAKMRNGTYPLEIKLGRYRGLKAKTCICKLQK